METIGKKDGQRIPEFVAGGGEMGQRIREYDWSATSLGPMEDWPQSLRTCVRIMLTSRQPIWIGWGNELIKLYNDAYISIVGGKHPWALGKPASQVWQDIWREIEPLLKQVMEKNEGTYVESQLLIMERNGYPEETYYTFSYTPIPGDNGHTAGMICANTDDTERIIGERQLKTLTELGKNLNDSKSNEEIVSKVIGTLSGNTRDFPALFFYSLKETKVSLHQSSVQPEAGQYLPKDLSLKETGDLAELLREATATKKMQVLDNLQSAIGLLPRGAWEISPTKAVILPIAQNNAKDPYGFLFIGLNPYRLLDDKYRSFCSLIADLIATSFSNVNMMEEERKSLEAMAEIDRAKTLFFSNISHEFRTPLSLLIGPIEDVLNDTSIGASNKQRMEVAFRNALRMQKLVNTVLEFSKIEAGKLEGQFTRVDICALTTDFTSIFRSAIEKSGMDLKMVCEEVSGDVYVDVDMWEKIILNLVSNAFKYSKKGTIMVTVKQVGAEVQISVSDTGVGIPEDQLDKIFQRFHRVENIEGRSQEGTGIGLAMVKELVRIHRGNISVQSKHGIGSTFTVTIPVGNAHLPSDKLSETPERLNSKTSASFVEEALKWLPEDDHENLEIAEQHPDASPRKKTVLLADDNADMRGYVHRLLSPSFSVITAINGEEAYEKALAGKPDLVLTDIMMPKLDGFGLLKKLRNYPDTRNIPVIFLSARAGEEAKVEGLDAGADDYLVKPFSAKELLARVEATIKIAQNRLASEENIRSIMMKAPAAMMLLRGADFVVEMANEKVLEVWDRSYEEVINKRLFDLFPDFANQGFRQMLEGVMETGVAYTGTEVPLTLTRYGKTETIYRNLAYTPVKNELNETTAIISVGIDVTSQVIARKKIEEEVIERTKDLRILNAALQQSNDDLQQFAHVASHDLKEPVRKIKTFGSRLQQEYGHLLPEKGQVFLNKVHHATDRAFSMIDGVLRYSTINTADHQLEHVDLNETIQNIRADLELIIQQKNAKIEIEKLPAIWGNELLIYQLFYNLINNSLKFSKESEHPIIHISSSHREEVPGFEEITITDNGIGFSNAHAEKIFETFSRLNSKDRYEGTGLGLALCKKIVERHNGKISASGTENIGAVFTILLPTVTTSIITETTTQISI